MSSIQIMSCSHRYSIIYSLFYLPFVVISALLKLHLSQSMRRKMVFSMKLWMMML